MKMIRGNFRAATYGVSVTDSSAGYSVAVYHFTRYQLPKSKCCTVGTVCGAPSAAVWNLCLKLGRFIAEINLKIILLRDEIERLTILRKKRVIHLFSQKYPVIRKTSLVLAQSQLGFIIYNTVFPST